jgi:hypothetical protein
MLEAQGFDPRQARLVSRPGLFVARVGSVGVQADAEALELVEQLQVVDGHGHLRVASHIS